MTHPPYIQPSFQSILFGPTRQPGRESAGAFMNGPLDAAFRLQRRRASTAALRNNGSAYIPLQKNPKAFPQLYYLKLPNLCFKELRTNTWQSVLNLCVLTDRLSTGDVNGD